jgi:hypothetical protein
MFFVADYQDKGTFWYSMVLGSGTSMAAGCYHIFGGAIIVCALSVGPYRLIAVCCYMCFSLVKAKLKLSKAS